MQRFPSIATAAALALALVAGCGGGDGADSTASSGDYCADLREAAASVAAVTAGDLGDFDETTDVLHTLRDEAPEAVAEEWAMVADAVDKVVAALESAGIDEQDLAKLQNGDASLPSDVDLEALQQAMTEVQGLASEDLREAGEKITTHAERTCDLDLDELLSSAPVSSPSSSA